VHIDTLKLDFVYLNERSLAFVKSNRSTINCDYIHVITVVVK